MADALQVVVRFLHVLFGIAWIGGILFFGHSVRGGLKNLPPPVAGPSMMGIAGKMQTLFTIAAPGTVLFGLWNQYLLSQEMGREFSFQGSTWNVLMGASFAIAIVMLVIAYGIAFPAMRRMKRLAAEAKAGGPPSAEVGTIQKRLAIVGALNALLGISAVLLMVLAVLNR